MANEKIIHGGNEEEVIIEQTFDAPRELVFRAWTDPALLPQWYAPHGCTVQFRELDIRTNGRFHVCINNPSFGECWTVGRYLEILAPQRIVYTMHMADESGNAISAQEAGMDADWPDETQVTVTFTEAEGKTIVSLHQAVAAAIARRTGAYPSWLEMFQRLHNAVGKLVAVDLPAKQ